MMKIRYTIYILVGVILFLISCTKESESTIHIKIASPESYVSTRATIGKTAWSTGDKVLLVAYLGNNRAHWIDSIFFTATYNGTDWNFSREIAWCEYYFYLQVKGYYVQGNVPNLSLPGITSSGHQDLLYGESARVEVVPEVEITAWEHPCSRIRIRILDAVGNGVSGASVVLSGVDYYTQCGSSSKIEALGTLSGTTDSDGDVVFFCRAYSDMNTKISVNGSTPRLIYLPYDTNDGQAYEFYYHQ